MVEFLISLVRPLDQGSHFRTAVVYLMTMALRKISCWAGARADAQLCRPRIRYARVPCCLMY